MARTRRRAYARTRLNLEIVGIAAVALAVFCGVALAFPHHAGAVGGWTAAELRRLFGGAAPAFPGARRALRRDRLPGSQRAAHDRRPRQQRAGILFDRRPRCSVRAVPSGAASSARTFGGRCAALVGNAGAWILLSVALLSLDALADQCQLEAAHRTRDRLSSAACVRRRCPSFRGSRSSCRKAMSRCARRSRCRCSR